MPETITEAEDLNEEDAKRYVDRVNGLSDADIPRVMEGFKGFIKAKSEIGDLCNIYGVPIHIEDFMPKGVDDSVRRISDEERAEMDTKREEAAKTKREIAREAQRKAREQMGLPPIE